MLFLYSMLVLLQTVDALVTNALVGGSFGFEGNPLMAPLVGTTTFLALKVFGGMVCVVLLWDITRRFPKVGFVAASCLVGAVALIVLWNASLFLWA